MKKEVDGFYERPSIQPLDIRERDTSLPLVPMVTVLQVKYENGKVDKPKCRICPNGSVIPDEFNGDTYAPAPAISSVRTFAADAARNMYAHGYPPPEKDDVEMAYLNAKLPNEMQYYMFPSKAAKYARMTFEELLEARDTLLEQYNNDRPAFIRESRNIIDHESTEIWKALVAIYGHCPAGKLWHDDAEKTLVEKLHMTPLVTEPCIYYKVIDHDADPASPPSAKYGKCEPGAKLQLDIVKPGNAGKPGQVRIIEVCKLTDDFAWSGDPILNDWFSTALANAYKTRGRSPIDYYLGLRWEIKGYRIGLSSPDQCDKIARQFGPDLPKVSAEDLPAEHGTELHEATDEEFESAKSKPYASLCGALLYVTRATKPAEYGYVHHLTRYMAKWGMKHWKMACRVAACIIRDRDEAIWFDGSISDRLVTFSDASYLGIKSVGCMMIFRNGGPIQWHIIRLGAQYLNSTFSCELKIAAELATRAEGLHDQNMETPGGIETNEPSQQWTDNKAAFNVATKPGSLSDISRHLVKDCISLRGRIANREPILGWCSTKEMIADLGTKFPRKPQYDYLKARVRGVERSSFFHNLRIPGADETTTQDGHTI